MTANEDGGRPLFPQPSDVHSVHTSTHRLARWAWGSAGTFSLVLGLVGVVLPGWPTTIFLIIAAACYARSSQRMYDRILANRTFGPHVRRFRETGGMPVRAKIVSLGIMWPFVLFAVFVALPPAGVWLRAGVLTLAIAGTAYILSRPIDRGA